MFQNIVDNEAYKGKVNIMHRDPWVITIDDFIQPDEADRLIELGRIKGYERSLDVGEKNFDGTYKDLKSNARTSTNAWCDTEVSTMPVGLYGVSKPTENQMLTCGRKIVRKRPFGEASDW